MQTNLKITGMTCGMCVQHVTTALQSVAGVQSADVNLASGAAAVQHDDATDAAQLIEAVVEAGYQAQQVQGAEK